MIHSPRPKTLKLLNMSLNKTCDSFREKSSFFGKPPKRRLHSFCQNKMKQNSRAKWQGINHVLAWVGEIQLRVFWVVLVNTQIDWFLFIHQLPHSNYEPLKLQFAYQLQLLKWKHLFRFQQCACSLQGAEAPKEKSFSPTKATVSGNSNECSTFKLHTHTPSPHALFYFSSSGHLWVCCICSNDLPNVLVCFGPHFSFCLKPRKAWLHKINCQIFISQNVIFACFLPEFNHHASGIQSESSLSPKIEARLSLKCFSVWKKNKTSYSEMFAHSK